MIVRRVGGWGTIKLHLSEFVVAEITYKQWLAVLVKAYPLRITDVAALPFPSAKPACDPASVETSPIVVSVSRKEKQTTLHAHTLWSDLSYQMVAPITHK